MNLQKGQNSKACTRVCQYFGGYLFPRVPLVHKLVVGKSELVVGDAIVVVGEYGWLEMAVVGQLFLALLNHDGQHTHVLDLARLLEPVTKQHQLETHLYPETRDAI